MKAKNGDTVRVHYTGKLENGEVFDSSRDRQPFELTIGSGKIIPGFEKRIIGMEPGNTKTFTVSPEEAYGPKREELIVEIERRELPDNITPFVGQQLELRNQDGSYTDVIVADMNEQKIILDANHLLAGKTLVFDVELIGID